MANATRMLLPNSWGNLTLSLTWQVLLYVEQMRTYNTDEVQHK